MSSRERPPVSEIEPPSLVQEDFEIIEDAVMETARGRWFLEQYATRLRNRESAGLLAGMRRLEAAMTANHDALMDRLSAALAAGTRELPGDETSDEVMEEPELAPRHLTYFRADEDIFEPAAVAVPAAVARLSDLAQEMVAERQQEARKRRIVVTRHKPGEDIDVPLADEMARAS
jgi:hypothetical protein